MFDRHSDRSKYFREQAYTSEKYVIPYIKDLIDINESTHVLEIGCGEGGNLIPFADLGCERVVGVDLSTPKIETARDYFSTHEHAKNCEFYIQDIYDWEDSGTYDIIIMRDVIEHIHDQERFMSFAKRFLKPSGKFFFGFPPWQNPFGGHQQMCKSKLLSKLPYYHILPKPIYKGMLKAFGESDKKIEGLLEIKDTRISLERFERISKSAGYNIAKKTWYLFNPNYETKFGLKPRVQSPLLTWIPYFRNYVVTAGYYVLELKN